MPLRILIIVALFLIPIAPTFWAIHDIPKRRFADPKKKAIWFLVVSTVPCLGALAYIFLGRRHSEPLSSSAMSATTLPKEVD
jgi:hypothetical protein